jgi:magnesium-transporting ATPase (P-type)
VADFSAVPFLPVDEVYRALDSRPDGLTESEVTVRVQQYGPNTIREIPQQPLVFRFAANFTHLMAILLWAGGLVGFVAGLPQLGVAIWLVNIINGVFSFWQEYRAERATAALRRLLPQTARVLRAGREIRVPAETLVPGDVLLLAEGEHVSGDARLVQTAELRIDQSTLTGESHPASKTREPAPQGASSRIERYNTVFAGTSVVAGTGRAVVYATAMNTEFGRIAHLAQSLREALSPLQREMRHVTQVVSAIALGVGAVFFTLAVWLAGVELTAGFIFAIGMVVAFVPEGLLPTVTLALAMGVQRMARRNALVKRLSAVETLGCTTVICTDKTGTLTQNEMTVREAWVAGRRLGVTGVGYAPGGRIIDGAARPVTASTDADLRMLLLAAARCTNARLVPPNGGSDRWTVLGDPTEAALLVLARKGGLDVEAEGRRAPRLQEIPFESRRKRMSTVHRDGDRRVACVKGAPRELLALCDKIMMQGTERNLDDSVRAEVGYAIDRYAGAGLRVLAVGVRLLSDDIDASTSASVERNLTLAGLVAMADPPRPEVEAAVETCRRAGIRVVMITGDYGLTAESIARRIGIIHGAAPRIVSGTDIDALSDAELAEALHGEVIFARVAPEHKLRVVRSLQQAGHVVAVTGDGVNDAPALKQADIGVAMGQAGTDVAKESADVVLLDDNFASIVSAVEEGRGVYANIKKFATYIFTSNTPEAWPFILFALSRGRIPLALTVMQVLSVDLGTDLVPALALGAETPEPGLMEQPPRKLSEHVITRGMLLKAYAWLGMIQSVGAMAAFYFFYWTNGYWGQWLDLPAEGVVYHTATAMTLACVVATQIGNLFAQRSDRTSSFKIPLRSNPLLWTGIATELVLLGLIVYVPALQSVFGTAAIPADSWPFLIAWMPVLLLADEARKWIVRRRARRTTGR